MIDDQRFEREVASVFAGMAPSRGPDDLLDDVFLTTGRTRPRPRWLALLKEPPMRTSSRVTVGSPTFRVVTIAILTLLLLLASLAAVGVGARVLADISPAPFGPARNGPMVYSSGADIYLADPDGGNPRAIVAGPTFDQVPWFSPGGTRIAFGRGSELTRALMVADADGSNVTKLLPAGSWWADFLPGDDQMLVTRLVDGEARSSIIEIGTGATVRDLDFGDLDDPWWFVQRPPDGHELLFRASPRGDGSRVGFYAMGVDGTGLRPIGEQSTAESDTHASLLDPSISPDGATILYWDWDAGTKEQIGGTGTMHLRDLDTGEELPVPFEPAGTRPQYSPDGTTILYEGPTDGGATARLFLVPSDGSRPAIPIGPTFARQDDHSFGFSPDGSLIVLVQAGTSTLIDVGSGEATELAGDAPEVGGWQRLAP